MKKEAEPSSTDTEPEKTLDLRTPDNSLIERKIRDRYSRSDWVMGRSIVEDELLVLRQGVRRKVGEHIVKHKFEDAVSLKIKRIEDSKIHGAFYHCLVTLCFAISTTTIIEFPYLCYKHGGVTFFVPYLIILAFVGVPLTCVELGLGQFCPLPIGNLFKTINLTYVGIGKSMLFVAFWRMLWNTERVVHSIYLAVLSIPPISSGISPWTGCNVTEKINSNQCFDYFDFYAFHCNGTDNISDYCRKKYHDLMQQNLNDLKFRLTPPFLDYVKTQVLPQAYQLTQLSLSPWGIQIILLFAWILICVLAAIGIKRASMPLVILKSGAFCYIAICSTISTNGKYAAAGKQLFFTFDSAHLRDGACWADAVKHVVLSLSLCDGTLHKLGSLNRFKTQFYRSVWITLMLSVLFSFCSAMMFYSNIASITATIYTYNDDRLVGTKAESLSLARIDEFTGHGQILLFTAFPEYMLSFFKDRAYLAIVLYYLTIAAIGLPSAVINMHKMIAAYEWSHVYCWVWRRWPGYPRLKHFLITALLGLLIFPCVFFFVQPTGQIVAQLVKHELVNMLFIIGFVEILLIAYAYDTHRFIVDVNSMHNYIWGTTAGFYAFCYFFATPLLLTVGCIYHFVFNQHFRVIDYIIPLNLVLSAVLMLLVTIAPTFIYIIWRVTSMLLHNLSFRSVFQLTPYWFPPNREDAIAARDGRLAFRAQSLYIQTKIDDEHNLMDCRTTAWHFNIFRREQNNEPVGEKVDDKVPAEEMKTAISPESSKKSN